MMSRVTRVLLMGICIILLVLALCLTWLRVGISSHPLYHSWVQSQVSQAIGEELQIETFSVQLQGNQLQIQLTGITWAVDFSIAGLSLDVDVTTSILQGSLVLSQVYTKGLALNLVQQANGTWGLQATSGRSRQPAPAPAQLLAIALQATNLRFHNVSLSLTPTKGPVISIPNLNARLDLDHTAAQSRDGLNHISASLYGITLHNDGVDTKGPEVHVKMAISPQQDIKKAQIYLQSDGVDLTPWVSMLVQKTSLNNFKPRVKRLYVEGDYWLNYEANKQVDLTARKIKLDLESDSLRLELAGELAATSQVEASSQDPWQLTHWRLAATELTGQVNGQDLPTNQLLAQNQQGQFAIEVPKLNLDRTLAVLQTIRGLPSSLSPIYALAPSGWAHSVQLNIDLNHPKDFLFEAEIQGASIKPWLGVPQIDQADGHIWLNRHGGKVSIIDDNGLSVRVMNLTSDAWAIEGLKGEFSWHYGALSNRFNSSNIAIKLTQGRVNVAIAAEFSRKGSPKKSMLQVALGMQNLNLSNLPELLPDLVLGDKLGDWLTQATPQGHVTQAALIYQGQPGISQAIPIAAQVTTPSLRYAEGWPSVSNLAVTLAVNSSTVEVMAESGHIKTPHLTQSVQGWQVEVPLKGGDGQYIGLQGQVAGEAVKMMSLVQQLPINLNLPNWLHEARPQGLVNVAGQVDVAFGHEASTTYNLTVSSEDVKATWAPLQADLRHIQFALNVNSASHGIGALSGSGLIDGQNISFKRLDQRALANPWLDQIPSQIIDSQRLEQRDLVIEFSGQVPAGYLSTKYKQPWLQQIPGELPFVARLATCTDGSVNACSQLSAQIDLSRAGLHLPTPINQLQQVQLLGDWHGSQQQWYAAIDQHHLAIAVQKDKAKSSGLQWVGGTLSLQQPGKWADPGQWSVSGQLDNVDVSAWWQAYQTQIKPIIETSDKITESVLPQVKVQVKHAQWNDVNLDDATIGFGPLDEDAGADGSQPWRLRLTSEQLTGQIDYFGAKDPLIVHVDYAHFDFPEAEPNVDLVDKDGKKQDFLKHIDPSTLPDANVTIDELVKNGESFGQWQFKTRHQGKQVNVHDLEAFIRHAHLQGNLIWSKIDGLHQSQFTGRVVTNDIANMLVDWGYGPSMAANSAAIEVQLEWPHSPLAFTLKEITGDIGLRLKQGRFADAPDGTAGLKILALMDVSRLMSRIKLDFSDIIEPGFNFDSINAHYRFNQGFVKTVTPLDLKSSSLNLTMNGWIDFNQRLVDNNVLVTLPVADKLPLAALLAGLPQLSSAIYIVNKLIGNELATLTSTRYQVVGSLDKPQVKLIKIFDQDD